MTARVPKHDCRWYPISHDEGDNPTLWACGTTLRCIKTLNMADRYTKRGKLKKGVVDMEEPPRWAQTQN